MCHVHYVPSAMCHDLDDLHDLNVLHDLNDLNDFHDLHKWTLTNENSPFYHVKKVHIKKLYVVQKGRRANADES